MFLYINNSYRTRLHCHVRIQTDSMEYTSVGEFETIVNCFTDADRLMDFAATWELQDSPAVLLRLYRLRNPDHDDTLINEQILKTCDRTRQQSANNMDLEYVRREKEIEESVKALMFDDEMDDIARACIEDGIWNPPIQVHLFLFCPAPALCSYTNGHHSRNNFRDFIMLWLIDRLFPFECM